MFNKQFITLLLFSFLIGNFSVNAETLNIATVNNGHMLIMKELSHHFTQTNPDINLQWNIFSENELREAVTQDVTHQAGKFDVVTIGIYEVQMWAKKQWLTALDSLDDNYDINDLLPPIRYGLSFNNALYAAPFYGESSMVMYRTDLMKKAGLKMPHKPTWEFIQKAAKAMTNKATQVYGICLRGKSGWGENMALITAMANSFGARWFNESWQPQLNSKAWHDTLDFYVKLLKEYGPANAHLNGFNENLALFQAGKCGMWIDATVAGSFVSDPGASIVAHHVDFALAPDNGLGKRANWIWAWSLASPASSTKSDAANKFISWATSKEFTALLATNKGWDKVPPGTRKSLYKKPEYLAVSPFAKITLDSIRIANSRYPTVEVVPYQGVQYVAIPEFQDIGNTVGKKIASVLKGELSIQEGLLQSQESVIEIMAKQAK